MATSRMTGLALWQTSAGWSQWLLWPGRVRGYAATQSVVESTRSTTNTKYWIWGGRYILHCQI